MDYCGIDVHQKETEICILDAEGDVKERSRIPTTRESLVSFFGTKARMRVTMEAGGSSQWTSRVIENVGHELVLCIPRQVRLIAESTLKSDQVDAEVLARLGRIDPGFLGRATHRSEEAQLLQINLTVRAALVKSRAGWVATVRGALRGFGYKIPGGTTRNFPKRWAKAELPEELREVIQPLVDQIESISQQIDQVEQKLETIAKGMPGVTHLRRIPGVGLLVALYFVLSIDDPERFGRSRDVADFFGLRPIMRASGEISHYGRITKQGDPEMRRLLVQAAHVMMSGKKDCHLKDWANEIAARRGKAKAVVALARKLAVVMHRLWVTGEVFKPYPNRSKKVA